MNPSLCIHVPEWLICFLKAEGDFLTKGIWIVMINAALFGPFLCFFPQRVKQWQTHCSTQSGLWAADPTWTAREQRATAKARKKTSFRRLFSITFLFITAWSNMVSDGVWGCGESRCVNNKRIIYLEVLVLFLSIFWPLFQTFLWLPESFEEQ